jgi:thiol-disulfide isomerase/thioredoxin
MALEPVLLSSRPLTVVVLGSALSLVALAGGCDRQSKDKAQPPAAAETSAETGGLTGAVDRSHGGSPLPDITIRDPDGNKLALKPLRGPLLLNLWATWCAPCVTELPMLDRLAAESAGKLQVLTVSQDMADGATVRAFLEGRGLTHLAPWLDPDNDLAFAYGGGVLPTTVYYDESGREVWRIVGGYDWSGPEAMRLLSETR